MKKQEVCHLCGKGRERLGLGGMLLCGAGLCGVEWLFKRAFRFATKLRFRDDFAGGLATSEMAVSGLGMGYVVKYFG